MQVKDVMNSHVVRVTPDGTVTDAARLIGHYNVGALPVCTPDGRLRGIVTDRDIVLRCVAGDGETENMPVKEIMTRRVFTVSPEDDAVEATRLMATEQVRRLPVVKDGRLVGVISLGDVAKTGEFGMEAAKALRDISSNIRKR